MDQPSPPLTRRQRRALARQERQGQVQSVQKRRNVRKGTVAIEADEPVTGDELAARLEEIGFPASPLP